MNIAQIVCRFKPYEGGISNMAYDHACGLADLGHQVTVFTPLYDQADKEVVFADFKTKHLKPFIKFGNAAFLPNLWSQLKGFDIIHLHYPFFGGAEIVWLLKKIKKSKIKLVITYHHDVVANGLLGVFFKIHTKIVMPRIIKSADKVIVTSFDYVKNSNIKEIVNQYPDKFTAIPPSVDLNRFSRQDKDISLLERYKINQDKDRLLVFVGALDSAHYFKGIDFLIDSFKEIVKEQTTDYNLRLVIVGGGEMQKEYQLKVDKLGLLAEISFAGRVSDNDLPKYYNLADAVILPSIDKSEAFGITLIEAMACAKPVIAADLAGVRSVFKDKVDGFVCQIKNTKDYAEKINKLLADDNLRQEMGESAMKRAQKLYGHEYLTQKLEEIFKNLVK